ncbi:MAG: sulfatase-like hydrolase/transferase [Planctomycetes bacterium]|nr:sulfatase-like hydrolase/transferase [Planctomycetota bacterium]
MRRRRLLAALVFAFAHGVYGQTTTGTQGGSGTARRPNVVILFPDQLRWVEVGCYGHPVVKTPNIDRLAAGGVRLTHAFTNWPVCSPARSVLLSGRYARCNGVFSNQDNEAEAGRPTNRTTTIAEAFKAAGYTTALIGKWHLRPTPATLGFTESLRPRMRHRYFKQTYYKNEGTPYVVEDYSPHHETKAAVQFIREHRDRPFFLYLPYGPPHMPVSEMPENYRRMYDPARVVLRDNVWEDGKLAYNENWFKIYMWDFQYYDHKDTFPEQLPTGMTLRELTALYYGQITAVDDCVGQVLDAIRHAGIEDDTIVLFTSDHGDMLGSHQAFNKGRHYEEAIHIPMIFRYPRQLKPAVVDAQVASLVDVMPTLLELSGVPIPEAVQGASIVPVITGRQPTVGENAAFIETGLADGVRTRRYVYYNQRMPKRPMAFGDKPDPGGEHLFDVDKDPFELHDLAADPANQDVLADLRNRTDAWLKRAPAER